MQLLVAHGNDASRRVLMRLAESLDKGDLEVIESDDGLETLELLLGSESPALALVDWDLPGLDGPELCRLVREYHEAGPPYIILLARSDYRLATGLEAGANDCVHIPADGAELRARINGGRRFAALPWEYAIESANLAARRSPQDDEGEEPSRYAACARVELEAVLTPQ